MSHQSTDMIFYEFHTKLLDNIDLIICYHLNEIEIKIKWSPLKDFTQWTISYIDDECTLPSHPPLFYLCSSSIRQSLNPTFYSVWFLLDSSFYHRLFSHIVIDDEHFILLLSLPDGRILALPESAKDSNPILWYTSFNRSPITILGLYYDLNTNLFDAILSSTSTSKFPKIIVNHFILCESLECLVIINSFNLRRILLDNLIRSACIYSNHFIYITANEIQTIAIFNLLKSSNEELINQTKILRFGQFEKLIVDGQEIILYYQNGIFERLNTLLPRSSSPSRSNSLGNQTKKLTCLTTTITNLQVHASSLQRLLSKVESFYQLNVSNCLRMINNQWKLIFNEQQLRIFQPNDFLVILLCQFSSNNVKIYQLISANNWIFKMNDSILKTYICQPILLLRYQNHLHCQLGLRRIVLPLQEQSREDEISIENYFTNKFKPLKKNSTTNQQYHLALTIRNDAAINFKRLNLNLARRLLIGQMDIVNIECKQQEIKVDTDAGLVDSLTIQLILSSTCLRRLMITFSTLIELFYGNKTVEDKHFIKQSDIIKLSDLIQELQTKLSTNSKELTDELLLHLLQIRIYLSMFQLGSNYTVHVY